MVNTDRSQGYVTDTPYADHFYRELSPTWINYVATLSGAAPRNLEQPFRYLELGCGFGHSAMTHAGAFPHAEFHACDFLPQHINAARDRASIFAIDNIEFHQASFEDLLAMNLPTFDFIALHGVYSWVGAEARRTIRHIMGKMLKPDGLVYLSYNCLPGWATEAPLRKLLVELSATAQGDASQRAKQAVHSLQHLNDSKLRYFSANPVAASAVETYAKSSGNYLAHEFLNQAWETFYSVDVAEQMTEAGLNYLGSATLADNHPMLLVDSQISEAVAALTTERQRQLAFDFAVNRNFRRDVFIQGQVNLEQTEVARNIHSIIIGCPGDPAKISAKVTVPRGVLGFQEAFISELRILLQRGSMTIGEAVASLSDRGRDPVEITRNLIFLIAAGTLMPFAKAVRLPQPDKVRRAANKTVERVLAYSIEHRVQRAIPCQTFGNGVQIQPVEALVISEWLAGCEDIDELATQVERKLHRLEPRVTHEGRQLQPGEAAPNHSRTTVEEVIDNLLPSFMRLGLIV